MRLNWMGVWIKYNLIWSRRGCLPGCIAASLRFADFCLVNVRPDHLAYCHLIYFPVKVPCSGKGELGTLSLLAEPRVASFPHIYIFICSVFIYIYYIYQIYTGRFNMRRLLCSYWEWSRVHHTQAIQIVGNIFPWSYNACYDLLNF